MSGGNLTVVAGSLGTPWAISGKSKILFFEETGERAYRVDRHLQQMLWANSFKGIRAVVFGDFINAVEPKSKTHAVLKRFAEQVSFPVLAGLPVGHGAKNRPIALNTKAVLTLGRTAKLNISSGCKV